MSTLGYAGFSSTFLIFFGREGKGNFGIIPKLKFIDPGKRKTGKICILESSEI